MPKKRLDQLLVEKELFSSRTKAQAAIMAGQIFVDDQKEDKSGKLIDESAKVEVRGETLPFVSRGGIKLEKALNEFKIEVKGKICLDVGASTGGFTDCLLQRGADFVYAVDVGYGQIDWKLRHSSHVKVIERTNARYLSPHELGMEGPEIELTVIDVSFISLDKILPAVYGCLVPGGEVVALVKPQFEAGREQVGKGGIVKDASVHQSVIDKVKKDAEQIGFKVKGLTNSPIEGADGNKEFLIWLVK
jgi:23S rRNA (cytidine1920-2'-O)/16S rRNA (cytidine1409-2'-O)-methyltransferase